MWAKLRQWVYRDSRVLLTSSTVAGIVILLRVSGFLQGWELAALDQWFRLRPLEPIDDRIVIVGIDEADLRQIGQWPIPDAVMAQLLQRLQTYHPRVIGLDIYRDLPVEPGHAELQRLYSSIPNLIGIEQIKDKTSLGIPAPPVLNPKKQVGFNNLIFDLDGKVRRGLLYWTVEGTPRKSFALALALVYLEAEGISPKPASDGSKHLQLGRAIFQRLEAQDGAYTNVDNGGYQILANLRGPANRFETVSIRDVLSGRVPAEAFRDRIVLIGSTAVSLKDFFYTSYSGSAIIPSSLQPMAGVELQANLTSQMLSAALEGRPLIQVWSEPLEWFWIVFWSWIGAALSWRIQSLRQSTGIIVLAGSGLMGLCYLLFLSGWWVPVVPPMIALSGSAIAIIAHIAHLQQELKRSKEFFSKIINAIPDPVFVKDRHHRWIVLNQAYCKFSGYPLEELLEKSDYDIFPQHEADCFRQQDHLVFQTAQEQESEEEFTNKHGVTHQIATKRTLHQDAAGNFFLVGVIRDITERKQTEEELKRTAAELFRSNQELQLSASRLHHLANHDALTGLPNRKLFQERLNQALDWANENHQLVALLFLDLDGFKLINDTQGHDVGDLLLQSLAQRLTCCLRSSDTVARLGGDEFIIILPAIPSVQETAIVAEKILITLSQPSYLKGHTIFVTTSIGISLYPDNSDDPEVLVKQADAAMYQAKQFGKNHYRFWCDQ